MLYHHSHQNYDVAASEAATLAKAKMEKIIENGRQSAVNVFEHVHQRVPQDAIVRGRALRFGYASPTELNPNLDPSSLLDQILDEQPQPNNDTLDGSLVMTIADNTQRIHRHAMNQLASKAGIPRKYLGTLVESENPHLRQAGIDLLQTHFAKTEKGDSRYLTRSVDGELRGFLSDRYRRLDNRPLLEAFAGACQNVGAHAVDGTVCDTRIMLKAYLPHIFEPVPNEPMLIGLAWGNSDFGAAAHTLSLTVLRLWCTNKAVMDDSIRNVHLGRRLDENIAYSQRTYELDTQATVSALGDTIRDLMSPNRVNALVAAIRAASEQPMFPREWTSKVVKQLTKMELEKVNAVLDSNDVMMLPSPGDDRTKNSIWRSSNAVSWLAGQTEDSTRRLELERIAGQIIDPTITKTKAA